MNELVEYLRHAMQTNKRANKWESCDHCLCKWSTQNSHISTKYSGERRHYRSSEIDKRPPDARQIRCAVCSTYQLPSPEKYFAPTGPDMCSFSLPLTITLIHAHTGMKESLLKSSHKSRPRALTSRLEQSTARLLVAKRNSALHCICTCMTAREYSTVQ